MPPIAHMTIPTADGSAQVDAHGEAMPTPKELARKHGNIFTIYSARLKSSNVPIISLFVIRAISRLPFADAKS